MGLDLLAAAVLAVFVLLGMARGLVPSGLGLASLILGYVNAMFAAKRLGPVVADLFDLTALVAAPLVGTAAFLATMLVFALLTTPVRRADRERASAVGRSPLDRLGGGVLGGARGVLVVVLLALLATWLDAAREMTDGARFAAAPPTEDSRVAGVASQAIEGAVSAALGGAQGRVAARIVARPSTSLRMLESVTSDPALRALQADGVFWMQVEQSQAHNAVYRPAFQDLVQNARFRDQLAELGAIDEESAASPEAFRQEMEAVLEKLGPRLRALKEDPGMQELANDPEVLAQLQAGDPWALLADGRVHKLAARIAEAR